MPDIKTPENTPVPGGGSWHWDIALNDWAENLPYGAEPETTPGTVAAYPDFPSSSNQPFTE